MDFIRGYRGGGVYHLNQLTHGWIIDYYVHDTDRWMKAIVNVPGLYAKRETTSGFVPEPRFRSGLWLKDQREANPSLMRLSSRVLRISHVMQATATVCCYRSWQIDEP